MSDTPIEKKPREFWLNELADNTEAIYLNPVDIPDYFIHVVEHSALVAAHAEIESLNTQIKLRDKADAAANSEVHALKTELAERTYELSRANAECEEQARLNGMGGERELKLQAEIERLKQVERDLQHEMRMQSALLKNAKAAIDQLNEELKIHALSDWPRKAQEYFNKGLSLEAEVESLNTLLESRERATQVHKALVDERDELKFTVESYRALLKEILEYFDAPFRAEGGKEYKLATSDVFEQVRATLKQGEKG